MQTTSYTIDWQSLQQIIQMQADLAARQAEITSSGITIMAIIAGFIGIFAVFAVGVNFFISKSRVEDIVKQHTRKFEEAWNKFQDEIATDPNEIRAMVLESEGAIGTAVSALAKAAKFHSEQKKFSKVNRALSEIDRLTNDPDWMKGGIVEKTVEEIFKTIQELPDHPDYQDKKRIVLNKVEQAKGKAIGKVTGIKIKEM